MEVKKVGIFFIIDNQVLADAVSVKNGEPYGETIGYGSHYEFWNNFLPRTVIEKMFKERAYDAYPRGRVVYFAKDKKFVVYADRCLKKENMKLIADLFGISGFVIKRDEHYKCEKCNPFFLD